MSEKIEIVKAMVKGGYCLFGETEEEFARKWDLETLKRFAERFAEHKARN